MFFEKNSHNKNRAGAPVKNNHFLLLVLFLKKHLGCPELLYSTNQKFT